MKITIENTNKISTLSGVPARIWEGETESGIKIICYVTRIVIKDMRKSAEFDREFVKIKLPSAKALEIDHYC